jgi:hypothetical protein
MNPLTETVHRECGYCRRDLPAEAFKVCGTNDLRERHCMECRLERGWKAQALRRARKMKGVDIDRIHYLRGAIRKKEAA